MSAEICWFSINCWPRYWSSVNGGVNQVSIKCWSEGYRSTLHLRCFSTHDPRYLACNSKQAVISGGISKAASEQSELVSSLAWVRGLIMPIQVRSQVRGIMPVLRQLVQEMRPVILTCSLPFTNSCQYPQWLTLFANSQLTLLTDGFAHATSLRTGY